MSKKATSIAAPPTAQTPTEQPQTAEPKTEEAVAPPVNAFELRVLNLTNLPPQWLVECGTEPEYTDNIFRYELEVSSQTTSAWQFKHTFKNGRLTQLLPQYTRPVEETQLPSVSFGPEQQGEPGVPTVPPAPSKESIVGANPTEGHKAGITWWFHPDAEVVEVKDDPKAKKDPKKAPPKGAVVAAEPDVAKDPVKPNSAYPPNYLIRSLLPSIELEKLEQMCESDVGMKFTFRRVFKQGTPADWEDGNETRYRAEGIIPITPFREPGTTTHTYQIVLTPFVDPVVEETDKKGAKKAPPKKAKGGMPAALTPEEVGEGEPHPYHTNQTTLVLQITIPCPLTKLPQNRPKPNVKPNDLIPVRVKPYQRALDAAKMFSLEVSDIVQNLIKEFRQFVTVNGLTIEGEDTRKAFFQFLSTSGQGYALKERLLPFVQRIVREKFNKKPGTTSSDLDKIYNELYVYLLEQLHSTLNKVFSREALAPKQSSDVVTSNKWKRLADEAEVMQEFALASRYHQERLVHGPEQGEAPEELPDVWCEYAEFCLRVRDVARAEQAYREAIAIDIGHTPSLLGYGLLLLSRGRYRESEVFLQAAVDVSMDSVIAWTTLALYYECHVQLLASTGEEDSGPRQAKSQREARYCLTEAARHYNAEQTEKAQPPYFLLAEYLLMLHLEELALICLKQCNMQSTEVILSIGRLYFQTMQYEEAQNQIKDLLSNPDSNSGFASHILMGDVLTQENRNEEAEEYYEKALRIKPEGATGGVYVRLGNIYMTLGRYKEAKDTFITGVKVWCCGLTWMGVGIAFYRMDDFLHAEQALNESNILNNQNPKTWAYLCLCCLKTHREEEGDFALNQALKLHLGDVDLLCEIGVEQSALGRLKLCEGIFKKCVALKPTYATTILLAQTYMSMRSFEEAHVEFTAAMDHATNETDKGYVEEQLRLIAAMQAEQ